MYRFSKPDTTPRFHVETLVAVAALAVLLPGSSAGGEAAWVTHGPPGAANALAVSPADPSTVYAAPGFGLFKSTDSGRSWSQAGGGLPLQTLVNALAVDPFDPATVYAATEATVYKTTDGGEHWAESNSGLTEDDINDLVLDPSDPHTIYVGADAGDPADTLFKSTDGGATWVNVSTGIRSYWVRSLAVDPADPQVLYAGTLGFGVLYKSTDGGASWTEWSRGIPTDEQVQAIAVDPQDTQTVYAATAGVPPGEGLYKSNDGGRHWFPSNVGFEAESGLDVVIDPSDPAVIYASSLSGVFKSIDHGQQWTKVSEGLPREVGALAIDPVHPSTLYAAYGGNTAGEGIGVFRTTDGAVFWRRFTLGLGGGSVDAVAVDPTDPNTVYAGRHAQEARICKSTDGGRHWTALGRGLGGPQAFTDLLVDPIDPEVLYASASGAPASPFKSTDGGLHWHQANQGMSGGFVLDLDMDPTDHVRLAAGAGTVYLSTDGARTWEPTGLDADSVVASVKFDPVDPLTIYAGTAGDQFGGGELHKTTDGGVTWARLIKHTDPWWSIHDVEVDPATPSTVYLGDQEGAMKSTDGGRTWTRVGVGVLDEVFDLAIDPSDPSTLYAGTATGVYVSTDAGDTWASMSQGLMGSFVASIAIDPTGMRVYVAAPGGGVFRLDPP